MIRLMIADDHPIVREGLRRIVAEAGDMQVVGETDHGATAVELARSGKPDVLLLDVSMPGPGLMGVLEQLRESAPRVRVLVLSAAPEESIALQALKAGAAGFLSKAHSPKELQEAIRRVQSGGTYLSGALAGRMAQALRTGESGEPHERLSQREFQVLTLIGAGKSAKQIAAQLSLSPKTVSTFRTRILEKLELRTTADLIRYAVDHGLAA